MDYAKFYDYLIQFYGKVSSLLPSGLALPPIRTTIELTYHCNLTCYMCYVNQARKKAERQKELTVAEIKKIIDQMPPKTLVSFLGGEPFMRREIFDLIDYATHRHNCNLVTNGTLIDQKTAQKLVNSKIILVGVSLDGLEKTHDRIRGAPGSFRKAVEGISHLQSEKRKRKKKYPFIDIKTVILPENIEDLFSLYQLCQKLKVDFFTISTLKGSPIQLSPPVYETIPLSKYFEFNKPSKNFDLHVIENQIRKILENKSSVKIRFYPGDLHLRLREYYEGQIGLKDYHSCYFPWTAFNVSPYGDVFPCLSLKVGNLRGESLGEIWNGKKMRQFRLFLKKNKVFPACQGCCNLFF